jgi:hypothetical protein
MSVSGVDVGIIENHEGIFDKFDIDAIVGMSYNYHADKKKMTLFEKMMD